MVNYDLPWVPMTIEQRIGRIQRLGQSARYVIVNNFYIAQTTDETIVKRLLERIKLFELAIGELEAILKEAEKGEVDFEEQIFELIMLSQERRDEEVARRLEQINRKENWFRHKYPDASYEKWVITSSRFSRQAKTEGEIGGIILMDRDALQDWLAKG